MLCLLVFVKRATVCEFERTREDRKINDRPARSLSPIPLFSKGVTFCFSLSQNIYILGHWIFVLSFVFCCIFSSAVPHVRVFVSLGLIFMDLPMGLQKFPGDDRLITMEELGAQLAAIENVNTESNSIIFIICMDRQMGEIRDLLPRFGYTNTQPFVIHKRFKTDKVLQGGFISAAVFAVIGFKDVSVMREVQIPEDRGIETTIMLQNVWISTHAAKSMKDNQGKPINQCAQDLMIPSRLIHMFKGSFTRGSKMTVLACGKSRAGRLSLRSA